MRMRKIQAAHMQEALAIARAEMGEDAMMLQSANAPGGGVVVTFAIEADDLPPPEALADVPPIAPTKARAGQPKPATVTPADPIQNRELHDTLRWHGIPGTTERAIIAHLGATKHPAMALAQALSATLRFAPLTGERTARAIMCVGAPGVGKTLSIAKLATDAVRRKTPLRILTTDTTRAGAYDQLAAFTNILGITLELAQSRQQLRDLLKSRDAHTHMLIDSAGCNPYDFQELKQLGELAKLQEIEPVLVLPLGMDASEAQEIAGVFSFLDIERVILSRLDCARRFGSVLAAVETGKYALANASASLSVAGGCPALTPESLADYLLRPARERLS